MKNYQHQRGSLMIVSIVMILVVGFLGVAITFLSITSTHNTVDEYASYEAFVLAESGLQRGIKQWSLAPTTYTGEGPINFGNGTFTVTPPVLLTPTQARIRSIAAVPTISGNVLRSVDAIVDLGGPLFSDPLTNLASWPTENLVSNQGSASVMAGGIRLRADNVKNAKYEGYLETGTAPPLITLNEGEIINVDLNYKKRLTGGGANPVSMDMAIELVDTTGTAYSLPPFWPETTIFNNNNWLIAPTTSWTVPNGVTINRIRLSFNLERSGNGGRPQVFFGNIIITSASGGSTSITSWQEVIP